MSDPSLWKVLKSNFCFHILKGLLETAQFLSLSAAAHKLTNVKRRSSVFFCYTTLEKYFFLSLPFLSLVSLTLSEIFMLSSPVSQNRLDTCVCMCVYVVLALNIYAQSKGCYVTRYTAISDSMKSLLLFVCICLIYIAYLHTFYSHFF